MEKTADINPTTEKIIESLSPLPTEIEQAIEEEKGVTVRGFIIYINGKSFRRFRRCGNCKGKVVEIDFYES